jgi:hypothetical protein
VFNSNRQHSPAWTTVSSGKVREPEVSSPTFLTRLRGPQHILLRPSTDPEASVLADVSHGRHHGCQSCKRRGSAAKIIS